MANDTYAETIAAVLAQTAAEADDTDEITDEVEVLDTPDAGTEADDTDEDTVEEGDDSEEQDETADEEDSDEDEVYEVKVNGETVEVTLDELQKGYMRQADYTRKTQSLPKSEEVEQLKARADVAARIDEMFNTDPVGTIADFIANSGTDSTAVFLEVAKDLIGQDLLHPDVVKIFNVTDAGKKELARQTQLRRQTVARENELRAREAKLAPREKEQTQEEYVAQTDAIFSDFFEDKGVPAAERAALRNETLKYMYENEMFEVADVQKAAKIVLRDHQVTKREQALAQKARPKKSPVARPSRQSSNIPAAKAKSLEESVYDNLMKTVQG